MLNKAVLALVAGLAMGCATAQAASVTTLALNYSSAPGISNRTTDFLVLGFADYLASPGIGGSQREEIPISGSLNGGFELPSVVFPAQVGWHAFTKLPGLPGGPSTNVWETNTPGPPGFPIELTSFGRLTEDHFSLMLFVQCFNFTCGDPAFPFSITFTTPDGVSIIPTPIPAALPMFAAGLGLLWFARRRTRRAAEGASRASAERQ